MNVLLIAPPFKYFPDARGVPARLNYTRPPLGLCYIASFARERFGDAANIRILDGSLLSDRDILSAAVEFQPDIVGFSAVTANVLKAKSLAAALRPSVPDALLVAGGPHVSVRPADVFQEFDCAVVGEGEEAFASLVDLRLNRHTSASAIQSAAIAGVVTTEDNGVAKSPARLIENLDALPFPARDLLAMDRYFHTYPHRAPRGRFTTMFTSRGCIHNCAFCGSEAVFGGVRRTFSLEYVEAELEDVIRRHQCSLVFFDDDEFLLDRQRIEAVCRLLLTKKYPMRWICHGRPEGADRELMRLMKQAGCVEIQVGVESGEEAVLRSMGRPYSLETVRRFFIATRAAGINTWATFIVGYPGETEKSIRATLRLALETDPTYASFIMLLPFPGTRIFGELDRAGRITTRDWSRYSWHSDAPVYSLEHLTSRKLIHLRAELLRRFYLRPGKLARMARDMIAARRSREMIRNFLSWVSVSFK